MTYDNFGNAISVINGVIRLHLPRGRRKTIGTINDAEKTLYIKRKREKHVMWKMNAYGFNEYVLKVCKRIDKIHLEDEKGTYVFPVEYVFTHGTYKHFQNQGFERQIFLHLNYIELQKKTEAK